MKRLLFFLTLALGFYSCSQTNGQSVMPPSQFKASIDKTKDALIIDVRTPEEFQEGHIENAINVDYYNNQFTVIMSSYPKDAPIYLYCRSGNRSGKAATVLKEQGFTNIFDLAGGFNAWTDQKLPYIK
jgi:rhodanese-related sulfurtransferase